MNTEKLNWFLILDGECIAAFQYRVDAKIFFTLANQTYNEFANMHFVNELGEEVQL